MPEPWLPSVRLASVKEFSKYGIMKRMGGTDTFTLLFQITYNLQSVIVSHARHYTNVTVMTMGFYDIWETHIRDCRSLLEDINQLSLVFPVQNGAGRVLQPNEAFYHRAQDCSDMDRWNDELESRTPK